MGRKLGVKSPGKYKRKYQDLTDDRIDAAIDFETRGIVWDKQVPGLRLYVGKRKVTWQFYADTRDHGGRGHTFKSLGRYDRGGFAPVVGGGAAPPAIIKNYTGPRPLLQREPWHMSLDAARKKAKVLTGKVIEGTAPTGARTGITFEQAFSGYLDEKGQEMPGYVDYLERKAASKGKPPRWAKNVRQLGKQLLLPKWGNWTLSQMSESPDKVADWIETIKGPTSANHCARIIRAMYKRRAKRDLSLSKVNIPTAAVEMQAERKMKKGMIKKQFPAWFAAWRKIESPISKAYHMVNLLTGVRPGELARTHWSDYDPEGETLTIGNAKAGNAIIIPTTPEIRNALNMARKAQPKAKPGDPIFPGCAQIGHREELPARGHALRRTWKTFAQNECGVREEISASLIGHVPEGMSQRYVLQWARTNGKAILEAQRKISREMAMAFRGQRRSKKKRAAQTLT
jgi:integrase